jgi:hypothetical protein
MGGAEAVRSGQLSSCISIRLALTCSQEVAHEPDQHRPHREAESGFDQVPLARRAQAYRMNGEGWTYQIQAIEKYVATAS